MMSSPKGDDKKHWIQIVEGDKSVLGSLFESYSAEMFLYGMRIINNRDSVKDAIQDVFVDLWHYRSNLIEVENIKFYLLKCLRNKLYKQVSKPLLLDLEEIIETPDLSMNADHALIAIEDNCIINQQLQRVLAALSNREREVVSLKYYSGLKIRDISDLLNLKEQTVSNTLQNALIRIRKLLISNYLLVLFLILFKIS